MLEFHRTRLLIRGSEVPAIAAAGGHAAGAGLCRAPACDLRYAADREPALRRESLAQPVTMSSRDMPEGPAAQRKKRSPEFTGG